jgi:hypothetical protein
MNGLSFEGTLTSANWFCQRDPTSQLLAALVVRYESFGQGIYGEDADERRGAADRSQRGEAAGAVGKEFRVGGAESD